MSIGTPKVHTARGRVSLTASMHKVPFFIECIKGFLGRNIKPMLAFFHVYSDIKFVLRPVAKIKASAKRQPPVALYTPKLLLSLPWGHHLLLPSELESCQQKIVDMLPGGTA